MNDCTRLLGRVQLNFIDMYETYNDFLAEI